MREKIIQYSCDGCGKTKIFPINSSEDIILSLYWVILKRKNGSIYHFCNQKCLDKYLANDTSKA